MKTHVKALVVGGGAVGTGIAYHLAKAGWDTMLVERDGMSGHAENFAAVALAAAATPGTILDVRLTARDGDRMVATPTQTKDIAA